MGRLVAGSCRCGWGADRPLEQADRQQRHDQSIVSRVRSLTIQCKGEGENEGHLLSNQSEKNNSQCRQKTLSARSLPHPKRGTFTNQEPIERKGCHDATKQSSTVPAGAQANQCGRSEPDLCLKMWHRTRHEKNDPRRERTRVGVNEREGEKGDRLYSEFASMTSMPIEVLSARQVLTLIVFLKNLTLPSQLAALTPPLCQLRAASKAGVATMQGGLLWYG